MPILSYLKYRSRHRVAARFLTRYDDCAQAVQECAFGLCLDIYGDSFAFSYDLWRTRRLVSYLLASYLWSRLPPLPAPRRCPYGAALCARDSFSAELSMDGSYAFDRLAVPSAHNLKEIPARPKRPTGRNGGEKNNESKYRTRV